jgi:hypothetical protein
VHLAPAVDLGPKRSHALLVEVDQHLLLAKPGR